MQQLITVPLLALVVLGVLHVLRRPHWGFLLVIAMWPIEQLMQVSVPLFAQHGQLFNWLIGTLALTAVVLRLARREPVLAAYRNPVTILVWALYVHWFFGIFY